MTKLVLLASIVSLSSLLVGCVTSAPAASSPARTGSPLGPFSISLAVKDLARSRTFYEALGFVAITHEKAGPPGYGKRYLMMRSGDAVIGLFQGLFDRNALTFNPSDVRAIQRQAKAKGIAFQLEAPAGTGPAAAMALDPDGNPVLIDQH
jgi:catechol 2,3-dioxygenase-like lactoylglutathione lyase family enzyme